MTTIIPNESDLIQFARMTLERLKPFVDADVELPLQEIVTVRLPQEAYLQILGLARWAEIEVNL